MVIWIALLGAICLWKISFRREPEKTYLTDYMSKEKTNAVRGIFILIVFMSHFKSYVTLSDALPDHLYSSFLTLLRQQMVTPFLFSSALADHLYSSFLTLLGQRMVTPFLFLSGYGVMESLKAKGADYVRSIPGKRFGGVLFRFDLAILVFIAVDLLIKWPFTWKQALLSLIGWDAVGNSNWYIFVILVLYLLTFLSFSIFDPQRESLKGALLTTLFTLLIVFSFRATGLKERYWYDTMLCYPAGLIWSLYGRRFADFINRKTILWLAFTAGIVGAELCTIFVWRLHDSFLAHEAGMLLFPIVIQMVMMRVRVCNPILTWCGKHLFGIYIMQRIPMNVFKQLGLMASWNKYLLFILCIAITILLAWSFDTLTDQLWKKLTSGRKKQLKT